MTKTYRYQNIEWIDIEHPTMDDIREMMKKHDINPLAAEELLFPTPKTKVEKYQSFIYLVLQFPAWKHSHKDKIQEIDFIIGRDFIITTRYDTIDPLHKFAKMFEVNEVLEKKKTEISHAGTIFYWMMREMYQSLHDELRAAHDILNDIQEKVFAGKERDMVVELSKISREILTFKRTLAVHNGILRSYRSAAIPFFGAGYEYEVDLIQNEYNQIERIIDGQSETIDEIRDTNDSLLSNKQNEVIQTLTVIIFITSILSIFVGLFAIDATARPIVGTPDDFWILLGIMGIIAVALLTVFIKKEWL